MVTSCMPMLLSCINCCLLPATKSWARSRLGLLPVGHNGWLDLNKTRMSITPDQIMSQKFCSNPKSACEKCNLKKPTASFHYTAYLCKHYLTNESIGTNSDCCYKSSMILVNIVKKASKTFQQITKADDFCCDWRVKDQSL